MRYKVIWTTTAEAALASLWLDAANRSRIRVAADAIDRALKIDAPTCGESRENDRRILIVPPLAVKFRVIEPDAQVRVLEVWTFEVP